MNISQTGRGLDIYKIPMGKKNPDAALGAFLQEVYCRKYIDYFLIESAAAFAVESAALAISVAVVVAEVLVESPAGLVSSAFFSLVQATITAASTIIANTFFIVLCVFKFRLKN
jgi:hypothetical protein